LTKERNRRIIKASWVAILGNAVLAVLKIIVGMISGSLAVVGDGLDSATDVVTSAITLITARIMSRPPNPKFPFGYERAETIATKTLSFVIFFAGAQLAISTISDMIEGNEKTIPTMLAVYVTIFSIVSKIALSAYLYMVGKKVNSDMIKANAKNMKNDVIISLGVLIGLFFTLYLKLPVLDYIFALLISGWVMYAGFEIFMESSRVLMDGIEDTAIYKDIFAAVNSVEGASNPHRIRIRKLGVQYIIGLDIEVPGEMTVYEAHKMAHKVESALKNRIENIFDIIIHTEPAGEIDETEKDGISIKDFE
jgi:cation diffusion facilitator family transporter